MTNTSTAAAIPLQQKDLANMLFSAAQEVFVSMLGCEVQQLALPETDDANHFDGVLSLIGLAGPVIGNGIVACSADVACKLSSRLLSTEFSKLDDDVLDAIGEITNMIVGGFKNLLEPHTGSLQMSTPSVVYGENITTRNSKADVTLGVRCGFPGGEIELQVRLAVRD